MAIDTRVYEITTSALSSLNDSQIAFESTTDADLSWKMFGGKNADSEITKFLGKDKNARVADFEATGDVTIVSGTMTIDSISLSTAQSNQVMYGDFQQTSTFKWESSKLRVGSTNTPEYLVDVESTTQDHMRIENSNNNSESPLLMFEKTSSSPADNDGCGLMIFRGTNDDPSIPEVDYVTIQALAADVSSNNLNGTLKIKTMVNGTQTDTFSLINGGVTLKTETTQTTEALKLVDSVDTELMSVRADGTIKLVEIADASAANESLYFSTDQNKPVWKDSSGVVNDLY